MLLGLLEGAIADLDNVDRCQVQLQLSRFNAGEVKDIVDHIHQLPTTLIN